MRKITFSDKNIKILQKNLNIRLVSSLVITYTDDFKENDEVICLAGNPSIRKARTEKTVTNNNRV